MEMSLRQSHFEGLAGDFLKSLVKKEVDTGEKRTSYMDFSPRNGLALDVPRADREARGNRKQEKHPRTDGAVCASEAIIVDQNSIRPGKQ